MKMPILTVIFLSLLISNGKAATPAQTYWKLENSRIGFFWIGFNLSADYLTNFMYGRGQTKRPGSELLGIPAVKNHVAGQRAEIMAAVKRDLGRGIYKQGSQVIVRRLTSLGRSWPNDFFFAIGGCTIDSYATVSIGNADRYGRITCRIVDMYSQLTDVYKWDPGDAYYMTPWSGMFEYNEVAFYAAQGYATNFVIISSPLRWNEFLTSFTL